MISWKRERIEKLSMVPYNRFNLEWKRKLHSDFFSTRAWIRGPRYEWQKCLRRRILQRSFNTKTIIISLNFGISYFIEILVLLMKSAPLWYPPMERSVANTFRRVNLQVVTFDVFINLWWYFILTDSFDNLWSFWNFWVVFQRLCLK